LKPLRHYLGPLLLLASPLAFSQNTCINYPSQAGVPFSSIAYVTAANFNGDHLVVGSLTNGPSEVSTLESTLPAPAFTNQTFCGQVQLAPQQLYGNVYVPTQAELSGNFSAFAGLLVNPTTKQPYPGGVIPASQLGGVFAWRIGATQVTSALQGWNPTGSMTEARSQNAAVLLPSGKVLVVGPDNTAEIYDPATGSFASTANMLYYHGSQVTATLLNNGQVLIEGGSTQPSAAELYDPVSGQFTATGSPIQGHGFFQTATLLSDGRVLVVGGLSVPGAAGAANNINAGAETYDPQTGKFTQAGPMAFNRNGHSATLLEDGRVLVAGGQDLGSVPSLMVFDTAETFDPSTGQFSLTGAMQASRSEHIAALLPNGKVLVGGGYGSDFGSADLFDPATNSFSSTGPMTSYVTAATAALLSSGQVLIAGGDVAQAMSTNSAELYNPLTGTFSATGNMGFPRAFLTSTPLLDGRVLVTGGTKGVCCSVSQSSAELYTPTIGGLVTSQTGLTFNVAQGAAAPPAQNILALSTTDTIPFNVSTHTYTGGNWLTATPPSGTASPATSVNLSISANPSGLAAQVYYGTVTLTPTDGKHPPISIAIVLNIVPAGTPAPPAVSPTGLVFLATQGSSPPPQTFTITNLTSGNIALSASTPATQFTVSPTSTGIAPGQSASLTVSALTAKLSAGVYPGSVVLTFSDGSTQTVDLLLVVSAPGSSGSARPDKPRAAAPCTPGSLLPVFTMLDTGFTTPIAWPTALAVQVVDNCGNAINTGTVTVSFSNGDPALALLAIGSGNWTGTWVPVNATTSAIAVRADAELGSLSGSVQVTGLVATNPNVPLVATGGVLSSGDYKSPPALGLLVSIFGTALADGQSSASSLPLPDQLGSTTAIVAGQALPMLYVSASQVNVLIPYNLAVNAPNQLIVQRGNAISVPVPIAVFDSQPAILATAGNGMGQGHIYTVNSAGAQILADANAPATAGNAIVIYSVGLGAVSPPVTAGDPASTTTLSQTTVPVTVNIGGQQAPVFFAGLTPGLAGLYQVNATVPTGITPGPQVPVTISVGGKSSSGSIYMAIQ